MADLLNSIPQLAAPFNIVGDSVSTVEQDSEADITQNAEIVLRYTKGERQALPEFGIPDLAFRENGIKPEEVIADVKKWEPDATIEVVAEVINQATGVQNAEVRLEASDLNG
jgi:phage baseplate assembly protein W